MHRDVPTDAGAKSGIARAGPREAGVGAWRAATAADSSCGQCSTAHAMGVGSGTWSVCAAALALRGSSDAMRASTTACTSASWNASAAPAVATTASASRRARGGQSSTFCTACGAICDSAKICAGFCGAVGTTRTRPPFRNTRLSMPDGSIHSGSTSAASIKANWPSASKTRAASSGCRAVARSSRCTTTHSSSAQSPTRTEPPRTPGRSVASRQKRSACHTYPRMSSTHSSQSVARSLSSSSAVASTPHDGYTSYVTASVSPEAPRGSSAQPSPCAANRPSMTRVGVCVCVWVCGRGWVLCFHPRSPSPRQ
eukprot:Rhum_TRINITY_DN14632_c37_g1::Rhum_TRINITY_DN14632_c37_g1_i1::g.106638::m.106638